MIGELSDSQKARGWGRHIRGGHGKIISGYSVRVWRKSIGYWIIEVDRRPVLECIDMYATEVRAVAHDFIEKKPLDSCDGLSITLRGEEFLNHID